MHIEISFIGLMYLAIGYKNLRTTQHYVKILDKKVGNDMGLLRKKLANSLQKVLNRELARNFSKI